MNFSALFWKYSVRFTLMLFRVCCQSIHKPRQKHHQPLMLPFIHLWIQPILARSLLFLILLEDKDLSYSRSVWLDRYGLFLVVLALKIDYRLSILSQNGTLKRKSHHIQSVRHLQLEYIWNYLLKYELVTLRNCFWPAE